MIPTSVSWALSAMFLYGFWAVFSKMATEATTPHTALLVSYGTAAILSLLYILSDGGELTVGSTTGLGYGIVAGLFAALGAMSYYTALDRGETATATTLMALFFVVSAVLGVILLDESLSSSDLVGLLFAMVAVIFIAR